MDRSGIDANKSVAHRSSEALPLSYLQRYGLAVVSIGVALGISLLLQHFGFRVPSALLLLFAVAISSWYAGAGPAVLAAILSTISFYWYFVEPVHTIYINRSEIPYFVIFAAFAALLSRFGTFRQRAEADLRRTHDQLNVERLKLGSRTIALLYFTFSSCWILFTDRLVHGLGLSNAYLLKVSEAKGILFISLSTLLMYVLVEKALRQRHSVATAYWQLVETAQEGVWSVDAEGKTVFANENMAAILGTSPGEMIGKSILPFVPQEKKDELLNHLLQREQGLQEHYEFPFLRADGAQVWTLLRLSPVLRDGQHSGCLALVSDITERKRAEEALRRLNRQLRAISNCNQILLHATDEQSLLENICRIVCEDAGYNMAWVGYAERDEAKSVRPVAWAGAEEGYLASAGITWADTDRGRGPTGEAIRSGKSCCVQDFATDPRMTPWRESLLQRGFRSGIALPLKDENDNAFGSLTIHSAQPNSFTTEEIRLLEELAGDMAFGIVTLRSQAARKRAEQEVTLLSFALDKVREGAFLVDEMGRYHYANDEGCRVLGYTRAELLGMAVPDIDPEFPAGRWSDHWRDLKAQRSLHFESRHRTRDGRIFPVEISANYFEYGGRAYNLGLVRDITERKRAEEAQRQSETELRQIVDAVPQHVIVLEPDGEFRYVNRGDLEYTGLTLKEVHAADYPARIFHPNDWERLRDDRQHALAQGIPWEAEARLLGKDGQYRWFLIRLNPLRDEQGHIIRWYGTRTNIEGRKQAEEALRRSEAYLSEAQRLTRTGSWALDAASREYSYWSDEMFRIFGVDPHGGIPIRETMGRRIHPEDVSRATAGFEKSLREKVDTSDEYRFVLPDGTVKHIQSIRHPVLNDAGNVVQLVGTFVDITERKTAEEALRESETRFRTFVDHAGDSLFVLDAEQGTIIDLNRAACESLGYTRQELIGKTPLTFHQDSYQAEMDSVVERAKAGKTAFDRHWHRRKDGSTFPVEAHTSIVSYGGRRFLLKVARDITDHLRAEEAVRQSEKQLRDVIEGIPAIASTINLDGSVEFMNRRWQEYTGMPSEESVGSGWGSAGHPKDMDHYLEKRRAALASGDPFEDEVRIRSRNGEYRWFLLRGVPLRDERGNIARWYATAIDIEDRKRAEEQHEKLRQLEADLAHIDRVSILGELAASIAHEINQPLSGIVSSGSACLRWLARDVPDLEEAREAARRIVRDGKRAGEIIARIRALTKKAVASGEKLDLNKTIREVLALVGDEAKRNTVVIQTRFGDDVFPVLGDQVQLQQVVLNLVMNAIEAMSKANDRARELVITTRNVDANRVQVTVEDSGIGIDPQMIDKVFDSFYTTKAGGMGMGLSISRSIVQSHGGRLWATAKDGTGTIFYFTLPKYHDEGSNAGVTAT